MTRCVLFILLLAQPASGIVINVDPWPPGVAFPSGSFPADFEPHTDPGSAHLLNTMNAAARIWGDAIRDPVTVSVVVFWEQDLAANTPNNGIALHQRNLAVTNPVTGGPVIENLIRFDNAASYYLDPTPSDPLDDGFVFTQTQYADLTPSQQAAWYVDGDPGNTAGDSLEVSYSGTASAGSAAVGKIDLLSLALHELGHAIALTRDIASGEAADNDFDIDPSFLGGDTVAVKQVNATGNLEFHIRPENSLMEILGVNDLVGRRYLPSATDILTLASAGGYTDIHLPRGALPPPGSGVATLVMLWLLLPVRAGKSQGGGT